MNKGKQIFWGVFWVLSAIMLVAWQFTPLASLGLFSIIVCVLLLAGFVQGIISRNIFGIVMPLPIMYIVLQRSFPALIHVNPFILIVAGGLVCIGLSMVFKRKMPEYSCNEQYPQNGGVRPNVQYSESDNSSYPRISISFGGQSRYLQAKPLINGDFAVSFGSLELFFDQVTLPETGANVHLDCSFGSIKLYIPRGWRVEDHLVTAFANSEMRAPMAPLDGSCPVLRLNGEVNFGNVEVVYI